MHNSLQFNTCLGGWMIRKLLGTSSLSESVACAHSINRIKGVDDE